MEEDAELDVLEPGPEALSTEAEYVRSGDKSMWPLEDAVPITGICLLEALSTEPESVPEPQGSGDNSLWPLEDAVPITGICLLEALSTEPESVPEPQGSGDNSLWPLEDAVPITGFG